MEPRKLNEILLRKFPELNDKFNEITSWQDGIDTGSFIVFEDVFMPFLEINVDNNNVNMIERIYSFIEELANSNDDYIRNILYVAILENISSFAKTEKYIKYLKNKSLKIFNENYAKRY